MKLAEGHTELTEAVSDQTARDIIDYRKKIKKPLTSRAAKTIARELMKLPESQRDEAVDIWFNKAWQGFYASWILNEWQRQPKQASGGAPRSFDNVVEMKPRTNYRPAFLKQYEGK